MTASTKAKQQLNSKMANCSHRRQFKRRRRKSSFVEVEPKTLYALKLFTQRLKITPTFLLLITLLLSCSSPAHLASNGLAQVEPSRLQLANNNSSSSSSSAVAQVISIRATTNLIARQVRDSTGSSTTTKTVINQQHNDNQKPEEQTATQTNRSLTQLDGLLAAAAAAESANASGVAQQRAPEESAFMRRLTELRRKYSTRQAISDTAYYILLPIYSLLILAGTLANSLICLTVILKPRILSPRNIFIVNLASSDLLLCVFTMPFSFIQISMRTWQMGLIPCKLVASLQATSIFVSTISITAIAIDRYKVIVYPTHQESAQGTRRAALLVLAVWIGALLISLPLFLARTVQLHDLRKFDRYTNVKYIEMCVEEWPALHGRGIYSVISMIFQYVLPISIVSVVYLKISDKLKKRLIRRQRLTQLEWQQKRQLNLIRRTHTMLVSVSLIFALSWLPLNLFNVISDFTDWIHNDSNLFRYVFATCHLIGCSSACSNPILYGYLNENFRKEVHQVYRQHTRHVTRFVRHLWRSLSGASGARAATPSSSANSSQADRLDKVGVTGTNNNRNALDELNEDEEATEMNLNNNSAHYSSVPDLSLSARTSTRGPAHSSCQHLCGGSGGGAGGLQLWSANQQSLSTCTCHRVGCGSHSPRADALISGRSVSNFASAGTAGELESSSGFARRFSFQTLTTSSRQGLSYTMRLCLCVCGSSSEGDSLQELPNNRWRQRRKLRQKLAPSVATTCTCTYTCQQHEQQQRELQQQQQQQQTSLANVVSDSAAAAADTDQPFKTPVSNAHLSGHGRRVWLRFWTREPPDVNVVEAEQPNNRRRPWDSNVHSVARNSVVNMSTKGANRTQQPCNNCDTSSRHSIGRKTAGNSPAVQTTSRRSESPAAQSMALGVGGGGGFAIDSASNAAATDAKLPTCYLSVETAKSSWRRKGAAPGSPSPERSTEVVLLNATELDSSSSSSTAAPNEKKLAFTANEEATKLEWSSQSQVQNQHLSSSNLCSGTPGFPATRWPQVTVIPALTQLATTLSSSCPPTPSTHHSSSRDSHNNNNQDEGDACSVKIELLNTVDNDNDIGVSSGSCVHPFVVTTDSNSSSCGCIHSHSSSCTCSLSSTCPLQVDSNAQVVDINGATVTTTTIELAEATRSVQTADLVSSCSSISGQFASSCVSTHSTSSSSSADEIEQSTSSASGEHLRDTISVNKAAAAAAKQLEKHHTNSSSATVQQQQQQQQYRCNKMALKPFDSAIGQSLDESSSTTRIDDKSGASLSGTKSLDEGCSQAIKLRHSAPDGATS